MGCVMKQNKKNICFLFVLIVFDCFAVKEQNEQTSFFSYLSHPTTLLCTGLASLGGYCFYNKESSAHAYEWLKQRFDETPTIIKCTGIGLGFISCYAYFYNKKHAVPAVPRKKIKKMRSQLSKLKVNNEELKLQLDSFIDTSAIETVAWKRKFQLALEENTGLKDRLVLLEKNDAENQEHKRDLKKYFEENGIELFNEKNKDELITKPEALKNKDQFEPMEHITFPKATWVNWGNRLRNLEIIVLGDETNEHSFSIEAPLRPSRFDSFEKQLDQVKKTTMEIKLVLLNKRAEQSGKRPVPLPPNKKGDEDDEGEKYN
jgi:hypothetical protein